MDRKDIKKYGISLATLLTKKSDEVENVRDENLQILNLELGGSIIFTDGNYYDLYDKAGELMFCDGETVILITTERISGENIHVVTGYDGERTNTYKFTQEEFDIVAFPINDLKQL